MKIKNTRTKRLRPTRSKVYTTSPEMTEIKEATKKVIEQYGHTLRRLGKS